MATEPAVKRVITFFDGQNLFHTARNAFGYTYPNYDVHKLAQAVCQSKGWQLVRVQFYTGIPSATDKPEWHRFWTQKLATLGRVPNTKIYSRKLMYRTQKIEIPNLGTYVFQSGEEKGIDVRLALDVLHTTHNQEFDAALIFSQDQDLSEVSTLIRSVAQLQNRWIKIASAFPYDPHYGGNPRGINHSCYAEVCVFAGSGCGTAYAPYPNPFPRFTQEKGQMHETQKPSVSL